MRSSRRRLPLVAMALLLTAWPGIAPAQSGASQVSLRIVPRVGQSFVTHYEQEVEVTGSTRVGGSDSVMTMRSTMTMRSRVIVQGRSDSGTVVSAITDSVAISASGAAAYGPLEAARRAMQGRAMRLHISPRGSAALLDGTPEMLAASSAVTQSMPAMLPTQAIQIGGSWTQRMMIPAIGQPDRMAVLDATYRLDSLTRDGSVAFISVRGSVKRDEAAAQLPLGGTMVSSGSIVGRLQLDLQRGWWRDVRATISILSIVTPPSQANSNPVRVQTVITQRMRTTDQ